MNCGRPRRVVGLAGQVPASHRIGVTPHRGSARRFHNYWKLCEITCPCDASRADEKRLIHRRFAAMRSVVNSLHDQAAEMLRQQIFAGELAPGSFVDEAALCERLAVSRTPLREALKVLVAEGLLRHEPRRGCFVAEITARDVDQIFPVIALLEGRAAFEATERAGPADIAALQRLHERLRAHAETGRMQQSLAEHLAVFTALKQRDAEAAEQAMRHHLLAQRDALRELARNHPS